MIEILTDPLHRIAYSTDASAYREVPEGVAYPKSNEDIPELMAEARRRKTHLIPRAAGTSIAGQVVGSGIVVDISRHFNGILEINAAERWARVQPGVVRDELNLACRPYGLFFSPETSTSNRCCIGGMMGNNSCGTHSLIYGSTRHHVLEAKGFLSDGSFEHFRDYSVGELEERFGKEFWKSCAPSAISGDSAESGASAECAANTVSASTLVRRIYSQLINWALDAEVLGYIEEGYPDKSLRRRSCGYAIDEVIEDLTDFSKDLHDRKINLCKLLAGSEGTLAFITEIKVDLTELPLPGKVGLCVHTDTLEKSYVANLVCLRHNPDAVELIDGHILELSRRNGAQQSNRFFVSGEPAGLLAVEFSAATEEEAEAKADALEAELTSGDNPLAYCCTKVYGNDINKVWSLRKAGLGLLSGMKGDAKPIGVIEDTAVAPERLPEYLREFNEMLRRLGLECVFYGHISTGELHLRPIINIKEKDGLRLFREVAEESARLVRKHRGSLSGEHGDGRLRGEFIPLLYGEECYRLMCELKKCWDPEGIFNIGKIVNTPPMDVSLRFDVDQKYAIAKELSANKTYFNWKAAFDECKVRQAVPVANQTAAFMCSIEQCNGAGDCRKSNLMGGTLCPAYKVSGDETKTTRARANVLREILTRGWDSPVFASASRSGRGSSDGKVGGKTGGSIFEIAELQEVLDSCLACKGCRSECPSNVDMTRLRAELLQHLHDKNGTPLRSFMVARMAMIERFGSLVAPLYNFFATWKVSSALIKKILKFSAERDIPALSRRTMVRLVKMENRKPRKRNNGRKVYLFADEFTNFQEAELGLAFARLLISLGYEVEIPKHVESGRAAISKGELKYAKRCAEKNVGLLGGLVAEDMPLVGIEPSCILSFRDEYPDLVAADRRDAALELAKNCLLFDEFLLKEMRAGRISAADFKKLPLEIWLHGHCHQKSLVGVEKTASVLRELLAAEVHVIPSGCCGMAGSFGYEKEHYRTSLAIGEMILFPAVRKAVSGGGSAAKAVVVAAPGTSCRQQIKDGTGVTAVHPVEILYKFCL